MLSLRKIPLESLIQILQDLYESGADYIDISGEENAEGNDLKDTIKITIKPDYMSTNRDDEDFEDEQYNDDNTSSTSPLSEDDINDLL
jgi:hypothetical protein